MKILSKYKDYYDYLLGTYGIDPKLVLDRRNGSRIDKFREPGDFKIAICGNLIRGFYDGEKAYCGDSLFRIGEEVEVYGGWNKPKKKIIRIEYEVKNWANVYEKKKVDIDPTIEKVDYNDDEDCPIMLLNEGYSGLNHKYSPFPKLEDYNIGSVYTADEMFTMLANWLSQKITEKENIVDNRDDVAKLLDKGFDKKCSFRPKARQCS